MRKKTFIFCLNRATDLSLAQILYWNLPEDFDMKIAATTFYVESEFYEWKKPKRLDCWLSEADGRLLQQFFGVDLVQISTPDELKQLFNEVFPDAIGIFPGREPFIIKDICNNGAICISAVRDYFNRYLDVHYYYNNVTSEPKKIKIVLDSDKWLDEETCGSWYMCEPGIRDVVWDEYKQDYEYLKNNNSSFMACGPYNSYKDVLGQLDKTQVKEMYNIPLDKKVVLVSLRRGDSNLTFHEDDSSFFDHTLEMMAELKRKGFYIISRRRVDNDDIVYRRANSAEITRYHEFEKYIDLDMSGWSMWPSRIWLACYLSDLMLLADMSGICRRESIICDLPMLLPKYDKEVYERNYKNGWDPAMRNMHDMNLFATNIEECLSEEYLKRLKKHKKMWHTGDASLFWQLLRQG